MITCWRTFYRRWRTVKDSKRIEWWWRRDGWEQQAGLMLGMMGPIQCRSRIETFGVKQSQRYISSCCGWCLTDSWGYLHYIGHWLPSWRVLIVLQAALTDLSSLPSPHPLAVELPIKHRLQWWHLKKRMIKLKPSAFLTLSAGWRQVVMIAPWYSNQAPIRYVRPYDTWTPWRLNQFDSLAYSILGARRYY